MRQFAALFLTAVCVVALGLGAAWLGVAAEARRVWRVELLGGPRGRSWRAAGPVTPYAGPEYHFTDAETGRAVRVSPGAAALVVTEEVP